MTPLARIILDRISAAGPIAFPEFMELALYHPEHGYYRKPRGRDPFGRQGDFFTAEQIQPVFGILMAQIVAQLRSEMDSPEDFTVVELGAGRREMAEHFSAFSYVPVDLDFGVFPRRFTGVLFTNEFFDALPVETAVSRGGALRELRVGWSGDRFAWEETGPASPAVANYAARYLEHLEDGQVIEANLRALEWTDRISAALDRGFVVTIDYGYTRRESVRFPAGTLMSYRRHAALDDVLSEPGERDITAHVNFTALEEHGRERGLERVRFENLSRALLRAGEADEFAAALRTTDAGEAQRRTLQLKTLLFGMGETFRVLVQRKG